MGYVHLSGHAKVSRGKLKIFNLGPFSNCHAHTFSGVCCMTATY